MRTQFTSHFLSFLAGSSALFMPSLGIEQDSSPTLKEAIKASKVLADLRLRLEVADFDNIADTANAFTYRARVGFETGAFLNTKFLVEFDHVGELVDDYDSTVNGKTN